MTTGTLTLTIIGALLIQVLLALMIKLWRRYQRNIIDDDEMPIERFQAPATAQLKSNQLNPKGWEGFKSFRVVRRANENRLEDICSFYLQPEQPMTLPDFLPGQYLTVEVGLQSQGESGNRTMIRCYSLSDRPGMDYYRISVKRASAPADQNRAPPGIVSNYLHDRVKTGDTLMLKAPAGKFHLIEEPSLPLVLIAGGIGITPMLSIINTLVERGSKREIHLFYRTRNGGEAIMLSMLKRLEQTLPHFHLHLCFSRSDRGDKIGIDYQHSGHVDMKLLQDVLKLRRYQYYICGPGPMMETLVPGLQALGIPASDIHFEAFGPASPSITKSGNAEESVRSDKSWQVTFSKSNRSAQWTNGHDSLLSFIEAAGVEVYSACRSGSCGSCQTRIESGEVVYNQAPDTSVEDGHCLLCVTRPSSDLKLAL